MWHHFSAGTIQRMFKVSAIRGGRTGETETIFSLRLKTERAEGVCVPNLKAPRLQFRLLMIL